MADDITEEQSEVRQYVLEEDERQEEEDEADSHPLGNPAPPPDVDLEMLRGDRIGDTVYSGKWCIETVMKLMQSNVVLKDEASAEGGSQTEEKSEVVDMDEDLQNQVGVLWDMTSNEEVCEFLHSVGAVESVCHIIANSRCPRATEMCVGMLANVITHDNMWKLVGSDTTIYNILIPLLANVDQPSLLEVTRFFNTALCHKDNSACYTTLCEWEELVTQELTKILSGSTHGELLRQTSELTNNLMALDTEERHFCSSFAHVDFVLALLEASREIGYDQASAGQNHLMDVLYHLTTYTAGAMAMENCLEPVACALISYLKSLCQNLSLSNDSATITTLLATLDHVYCRHSGVQEAIFSSPRVLRYVLKVLVTVYRRLGLYHLISHSHHTPTSEDRKEKASLWTEMDDTPTKTTTEEAGSWSERATGAVTSTLRTPEASPVRGHRGKELEISWSERRVGTPLADQFVEEVWKRPRELKRVSRRKETPGRDEKPQDVCQDSEMVETSGDAERGQSQQQLQQPDEEARRVSGELEESSGDFERNSAVEDRSEGAGRINYQERYDGGDHRKSGGFSPHAESEHVSENEHSDVYEKLDGSKNDSFETSESVKKLEIACDSAGGGQSDVAKTESQTSGVRGVAEGSNGRTSSSKFESDDEEEEDVNDEAEHKGDEFEETAAESTTTKEDKYHSLLRAIQELLTDFVNTFSQSALKESSSGVCTEMVTYLDKRCSKTEIHALVKCVGEGLDAGQPLARLLDVCEKFKAKHLESVVTRGVRQLQQAGSGE